MSDTERSGAEAAPLRRPKVKLLAAVMVVGVLAWYLSQHVQHQTYAMEYTVGQAQALVETWTLPLPAGFEAVYWKSTPHTAQDGLRIFRPDQP